MPVDNNFRKVLKKSHVSRHPGVLLLVAGAACRHVSGSECDPVDTSEGCNMVTTDTGGWDCLCGMGCARWALVLEKVPSEGS